MDSTCVAQDRLAMFGCMHAAEERSSWLKAAHDGFRRGLEVSVNYVHYMLERVLAVLIVF